MCSAKTPIPIDAHTPKSHCVPGDKPIKSARVMGFRFSPAGSPSVHFSPIRRARDYHRHGHTSASRTASRRFASITRIEGIVTRIGDPAWKGAISRDACSCTTTKIKRKVLPKVRHPTNENAPDSVKSWDAR